MNRNARHLIQRLPLRSCSGQLSSRLTCTLSSQKDLGGVPRALLRNVPSFNLQETQRAILNAVVLICKKHSALHSVKAQKIAFKIYLLVFTPLMVLEDI